MAFLFIDECSFDSLDLSALTGVLVPLEAYNPVRDAMCQLTWDVLNPPPNVVPAPIEFHSSDLLNKIDGLNVANSDELRLHVLSTVVNIVNTHGLQLYRVAYLNRKEIAARMPIDQMLYGLNFFGMQSMLQNELGNRIILPVMDGIPGRAPSDGKAPPRIDPAMLRAFDRNVRWIHNARCHTNTANNLSIKNVHNLAEPVFADSEHSTLLQLADLTSYLLLQREREDLSPPSAHSEFRLKLLRIAAAFRDDLVHAWKGKMHFH
jgi:hypothetical protein